MKIILEYLMIFV